MLHLYFCDNASKVKEMLKSYAWCWSSETTAQGIITHYYPWQQQDLNNIESVTIEKLTWNVEKKKGNPSSSPFGKLITAE